MNNNQRSEPPKNAVTATPTPQTSNSRVAMGTWSGPNISMEVTESGARLEFVCAHGTMAEPLILKDEELGCWQRVGQTDHYFCFLQ